jgi:Tol biopolymer transport system component/DNA-binding winged helix-turn-helix (wHTH) protein
MGEFRVQPQLNTIRAEDREIQLQPRVMELLVHLADRAGEVVSKESLVEGVWKGAFVSDEAITFTVSELRKCLGDDAKSPRYIQTIAKKGYRLIASVEGKPEEGPQLAKPRFWTRPRLLWGGTALAAAAGALTLAALRSSRPPRAADPVQFEVFPPPHTIFAGLAPAMSPDGRKLAFVAVDESGISLLWVRRLESVRAQAIPGTEDASYPFWSPDNRSIGFFAQGKLKTVALDGRPPRALCQASNGRGGTWSPNGTILFAPEPTAPLFRISENGGGVAAVTRLDPTQHTHRWPQFLPDGESFLFLANDGAGRLYLGSLDAAGIPPRLILESGTAVLYAPPGYLLWMEDGNLNVQPFDAERGRLSGSPSLLVEPVGVVSGPRLGCFSSGNGVLVYGTCTVAKRLAWFDRSGKELRSIGAVGHYFEPRLSPDEKRLALVAKDRATGFTDIWIVDLVTGAFSRLTSDPFDDGFPVWSPDGSSIVFTSSRAGRYDLYEKPSSGGKKEELLLRTQTGAYGLDWSSDGRFILYSHVDPKNASDLWMLPRSLNTTAEPRLVIGGEFDQDLGSISPDGAWIAYASNESGAWEVYVEPLEGPRGKWRISTSGGVYAQWRGDGREIFYRAPDGKILAVAVTLEGRFQPGDPRVLFATRPGSDSFAATLDGKSFLLLVPEPGMSSPFTVVLNWPAIPPHD